MRISDWSSDVCSSDLSCDEIIQMPSAKDCSQTALRRPTHRPQTSGKRHHRRLPGLEKARSRPTSNRKHASQHQRQYKAKQQHALDIVNRESLADNLAAVFRSADGMGGQSWPVPPLIKGCAQCAAVYLFTPSVCGHPP